MSQIPLAPIEVAFVELVQQNYDRDVALAEYARSRHLTVLFREKGIPDGVKASYTDGLLIVPDVPDGVPEVPT